MVAGVHVLDILELAHFWLVDPVVIRNFNPRMGGAGMIHPCLAFEMGSNVLEKTCLNDRPFRVASDIGRSVRKITLADSRESTVQLCLKSCIIQRPIELKRLNRRVPPVLLAILKRDRSIILLGNAQVLQFVVPLARVPATPEGCLQVIVRRDCEIVNLEVQEYWAIEGINRQVNGCVVNPSCRIPRNEQLEI